jgi:hypothetical protein
MININAHDFNGQLRPVKIDKHADVCPICHHALLPRFVHAHYGGTDLTGNIAIQILYLCTREECQKLFISYYRPIGDHYCFKNSLPLIKSKRGFSESISKISPSFNKIYNEAFIAEQDGLLEICGVGYRKAFEFLIKDYLIKTLPENRHQEIKRKFLGKCISEDIDNKNIKDVAKRAAWLGNDETHYERQWSEKDLNDLKKLIDITVYWIDMQLATEDVLKEMPEE